MEGNHWYTVDGMAAHTQPTKKGAKNPFRPTTIKDAKEQKLLPSVSSILKVVANPALDRWKMMKVAEACYKQPPIGDESLDDYTRTVLDKAFDEASSAADLGTRIHANIEAQLTGKLLPHMEPEALQPALAALDKVREMGLLIEASEERVVCKRHGFAGTCDLVFAHRIAKGIDYHGVLDFKTTKTKEGEPIATRFGQPAQIAAYLSAHWNNGMGINDHDLGYNLYVSTTEIGRVDVVKYDHTTLQSEFDMFLHACAIWRHRYAYDPRS
jgi:hypothetical protein